MTDKSKADFQKLMFQLAKARAAEIPDLTEIRALDRRIIELLADEAWRELMKMRLRRIRDSFPLSFRYRYRKRRRRGQSTFPG